MKMEIKFKNPLRCTRIKRNVVNKTVSVDNFKSGLFQDEEEQ